MQASDPCGAFAVRADVERGIEGDSQIVWPILVRRGGEGGTGREEGGGEGEGDEVEKEVCQTRDQGAKVSWRGQGWSASKPRYPDLSRPQGKQAGGGRGRGGGKRLCKQEF